MRARFHTRTAPRIRGFDTEACKGNLLVVCSPSASHKYRGDKDAPRRLLEWLWDESLDTNFLYNLAYDRDVISKPFARRMKKGSHSVRCAEYELSFLGNKSFMLMRKGSHRVKRFFDISGFFADGDHTLPLDETARLFLGEGKLPDVDRETLGSDPRYYPAHRAKVIEYCKRDAYLAERLGKLLESTIWEALGFYPSRFNSKASISKAWAEVHHPEILNVKHHSRHSLARESYKGGIFHTPILGRVRDVVELDIASAYGDALRKLPRLDRLKRRVSNTYHSEALLGSYRILIDYDSRLPLTAKARGKKTARTVYPDSRGKLRPYTATKSEMEYFVSTERTFIVTRSEEWFGPYEPQFPQIESLLQRVSALKTESKTDPKAKVLRMLFKTIVNALYGCLAESKHGETPLTNWPLAAEITGRCRAKIWDEWDHLVSHGYVVVSVNTDSLRFATLGPRFHEFCDYCYKREEGTGRFECKLAYATVTHFQSGIALIEPPNGPVELRKRGKPLLTADMLRKATGPVLGVPSKHVTHLFEALSQDRTDEIGVFDNPEDPESNTVLDLTANLQALDFDPAELRFEVLNERPVIGRAPVFDDITNGRWVGRTKSVQQDALATAQTYESPSKSKSRSSRALPHMGRADSTSPRPSIQATA